MNIWENYYLRWPDQDDERKKYQQYFNWNRTDNIIHLLCGPFALMASIAVYNRPKKLFLLRYSDGLLVSGPVDWRTKLAKEAAEKVFKDSDASDELKNEFEQKVLARLQKH